jgi:hypothetical protein
LLAAGVGAFQILETARVVRRSTRSTLSYDIFTQGSFSPTLWWKSFIAPLFYVIDMTTYVPPLAAALVLVAVYMHARPGQKRDLSIFFWLAVAIAACVLMLGAHTPVYRVIYRVPLLNRFRVPSRHTFEWTFAAGVLVSYGWDALAPWLRRRRETRSRTPALTLYLSLALLAGSAVIGAMWWRAVQILPVVASGGPGPKYTYLAWKMTFALLTLLALWRASLIAQARWRFGMLLAAVLVLCFVEPSLLVTRWWGGIGFPASRFTRQTEATRFLQQYPPNENRVYTRVELMNEQYGDPPRFDSANLTAVHGLHNVAGYEPLILERYSRALGGAWLDAVRTDRPGGAPDSSLFSARSHVLDILNTTFVVSYPDLATSLDAPAAPRTATEMEGIGEVSPQTTMTLIAQPTDADALMFVTSLSNSTSVPDGQVVARVRVVMADGKIVERELQAGRDTAEWAHERPDVRPLIRHKLATPYDTVRVGGEQGYAAYRFKTLVKLDGPASVIRVEIANVSQIARLAIYGGMLLDSRTQHTVPLAAHYSDTWLPVYDQNLTLILRNTRVLPRTWLVAEAEAVDGEEALRRIRGESAAGFDPRRTVLLEGRPEDLPQLPGGVVAPNSSARITRYEANRLQIETNAPTATVLVVSEIFYPGWVATIDGQPARINVADYLVRGVALPAGQHRVEMHYTAPAARSGAIISGFTLCLIAGLGIYAWRKREGRPVERDGDAST